MSLPPQSFDEEELASHSVRTGRSANLPLPNLPRLMVPGVLTGEGGLRGRVQTASGFHGRSCMLNDTGMLNKMAPVCVGNAKRNMICGWVDERQAAKFLQVRSVRPLVEENRAATTRPGGRSERPAQQHHGLRYPAVTPIYFFRMQRDRYWVGWSLLCRLFRNEKQSHAMIHTVITSSCAPCETTGLDRV